MCSVLYPQPHPQPLLSIIFHSPIQMLPATLSIHCCNTDHSTIAIPKLFYCVCASLVYIFHIIIIKLCVRKILLLCIMYIYYVYSILWPLNSINNFFKLHLFQFLFYFVICCSTLPIFSFINQIKLQKRTIQFINCCRPVWHDGKYYMYGTVRYVYSYIATAPYIYIWNMARTINISFMRIH